MNKYLGGFLALACAVSLTACGGKGETSAPLAAEDEFVVTVACESEEVRQIGYKSYIDGESRTMGGGVELDGNAASGCTIEFRFSREDFQDEDDISQFSMTLSPYGAGDREMMTTEPVVIPAEYGNIYQIDLSGGREAGFAADLKEA